MPSDPEKHAEDYQCDKQEVVHRHLMRKRLEFGQNGLLARGAEYAKTRSSLNKIKQGWDRLDVVPKTKVEAVIRVDLYHFDVSCALGC